MMKCLECGFDLTATRSEDTECPNCYSTLHLPSTGNDCPHCQSRNTHQTNYNTWECEDCTIAWYTAEEDEDPNGEIRKGQIL